MITIAQAVDRLSAALGAGPAARLAAAALIEADALGLPQFGIAMLGEWTANASPAAPSKTQTLRWIDCAGQFAPLAVAAATLELAEAARQRGVAAIFLRGVRGFGRLAPFVRLLADEGLVAIAGAEGPPFVAPFGGNRAVIGTNPLALAIGRGNERVVIDLASSMATMADVRLARASGAALQDGVAVDNQGQPTHVAADVAALLPRGGQIGSLVGLMVELLAGVAGGGRGDPKGRGVFMMAFDADKAGETVDWRGKLAGLKEDWTEAHGHWPRGGNITPDAKLGADFSSRLEAHLARMTGPRSGTGN